MICKRDGAYRSASKQKGGISCETPPFAFRFLKIWFGNQFKLQYRD
jgi:hypothetical protein